MARGFCVDCNYHGSLEPSGDCPRCGSDWTTGPSEQKRDEDQLEGLDFFGAKGGGGGDEDESYDVG